MAILYTARVRAEGGRAGTVRSDDGVLDLPLASPKQMGGNGNATNPEQLFAAAYAACFESSLAFLAARDKKRLDKTAVTATVTLDATDAGPFVLGVVLECEIGGMDQAAAEALVAAAHEVCPYSHATRGNIQVELPTRAV